MRSSVLLIAAMAAALPAAARAQTQGFGANATSKSGAYRQGFGLGSAPERHHVAPDFNRNAGQIDGTRTPPGGYGAAATFGASGGFGDRSARIGAGSATNAPNVTNAGGAAGRSEAARTPARGGLLPDIGPPSEQKPEILLQTRPR